MNSRAILATFATLLLGAGCGVRVHDGGPRGGGSTGPGSGGGSTTGSGDIPTFVIDAGAGVNLPDLAYAVTTNGLDWTLAWTGDVSFRHFEGEIIGAGTLSGLQFVNGFAGDQARQVEPGRVQFDASTDGALNQSITLRSDSQPVRFNLYIDGSPAVGAVVFSSAGALATTDAMPFDLLTEDQVRARGATVTQARPFERGDGGRTTDSARSGARLVPAPGAAEHGTR